MISIRKKTENITIPSEEERLEMLTMDYKGFRWAMSDTAIMPLLQKQLERNQPIEKLSVNCF